MSINLITGKPGAGKSYLAIQLLIDTYYNRLGAGLYEYKNDDVLVATNIDGLKLPSFHIDQHLRHTGITFEQFFTAEYQEEFTKKEGKKIVYVLDECQRQIGPRFKNESTIYYFDFHRHFDHEIWLISQDRSKICKQIAILSELEYRAVSRSLSIAGELKYNILQSGEHVEKKVIRPKKEIFNLYKSAVSHNQKHKKSKLYIYIIIGILMFVGCGAWFFNRMGPTTKDGPIQSEVSFTPTLIGQVQAAPAPPVNLSNYAWCMVSHVLVPNKKELFIYDYLTSQFLLQSDYPFPIKIRGNIVYAYLPSEVIQTEHGRDVASAGPQAGPRANVGGSGTDIISNAARRYQGLYK